MDAAAIREFAEAVGSTDPVHTALREAARARGYRDVIAPPTFAVLIAQQCDGQLIDDPEAGIDFRRVVHGEQRFVHHRPITAGDEVVGTLTVDAVREAGGHAMVTTRTELATTDGEAGVHRDVDHRHPGRGVSMGRAHPGARLPSATPSVRVTIHGRPATTLVAVRRRLPRPQPHPLGRALRDVRRACPTSSPTACSPWARPARVVTEWVGDAGRVVEYGTRFTKPVVVPCEGGADIEVSGVVKAVDAETRRATVELTATSGGDKVLGRASPSSTRLSGAPDARGARRPAVAT